MVKNDDERNETPLTNYCEEAEGILKYARLDWADEPQAVCTVDYSERERNPYDDLWGVAFRYNANSSLTTAERMRAGDHSPDIHIRVVGGTLDSTVSLPQSALQNTNSCIGQFYRRSDAILAPAHLAWRPDSPYIVCLINHSNNDYHTYEGVWEIIFQTGPTDTDRLRGRRSGNGDPCTPYLYLDIGDSIRAEFD